MNAQSKADALILTALPSELEAVRAHAGPWKLEYDDTAGVRYFVTQASHGLRIAVTGMTRIGPVSAATATTNALAALRPKRVLLVGVCAGIAPQVSLGDICISDQIVDYDNGKVRDGSYEPRYRAFPADAELVRAARYFTDYSWADNIRTARPDNSAKPPTVHIGTVLSGGRVVADSEFREKVRHTWPEAIALEMEGGGSASAAHEHICRPSFILVKGVCDDATRSKNDEWQGYAADIAGKYALSLLLEGSWRGDIS